MIPQTDKSWPDYRALIQNWSHQPTLAGRAIFILLAPKRRQQNLCLQNLKKTFCPS